MSIRRVSWLVSALFIASAVNDAAGQVPVTVSVATDGTPGNSNSLMPAMSATGRFVAFMSFASNLVPDDTNGERDVFLRDRDTDADGVFDEPGAVATIRVSELHGLQANRPSEEPAITPDGRYIVFTSFASNLFTMGQPTLAVSVVLRWDRTTGDIVLVSQTTASEPLLAVRSIDPDVSDDGNQVVFRYGGSLLSESDAGFRGVIYRRDIAAGTLTQVSTAPPAGAPFVEHNALPSISGDGATIAYGVEVQSGLQTLNRLAHVVDAATNTITASYIGAQPRCHGTAPCWSSSTAPGRRGRQFESIWQVASGGAALPTFPTRPRSMDCRPRVAS
jgi:WD40-like Beta Propeller Repeat